MLDVDACSASGYKIETYSGGKNIASATDFVNTSFAITGSDLYGYEQFVVSPIKATDDLYVKAFTMYEAVQTLDDDLKIDKGFVKLSAGNEAINDQMNKITYADDKANVELNYNYGGFGVAYYLKGEGKSIDLSDYSKIILNITTTEKVPVNIKLYNAVTGNTFWERIGSPKGAETYRDFTAGTNDYEINIESLKGELGNAEAIFIKYNPGEATTNAQFTINSIQLV